MPNSIENSTNEIKELNIELPPDVTEFFTQKNVLVTGGTGMIGRQVIKLLKTINCKITCVSLDDLSWGDGVKYIKADITNSQKCLEITKGQQVVLHIAGIKGSVNVTKAMPARFYVPLVLMNTNMLEASVKNGVENMLYTSSIGAYSPAEEFVESDDDFSKPPMDMFPGWAKRMAELQIQAYQIEKKQTTFSIVRPSNIYGPGDNFDIENAMVIPSLIAKIIRGDNPVSIWGDGSAERDFLHSYDAAYGMLLAAARGTDGRALNLGAGFGVSIRKLVEVLQEIRPFKAFFDKEKSAGFPRRIMDISLAKSTYGFTPQIDLKMGLTDTMNWYQENSEEHKSKQNYFK
ncbi:NAD-dependent epimerase/dehydratase family protein [Paracoccaceae bacterium]|nr:NAD-dependent epimerase/dehydratase family protein [Paracoccaceae bacterium]